MERAGGGATYLDADRAAKYNRPWNHRSVFLTGLAALTSNLTGAHLPFSMIVLELGELRNRG